MKDKTLRQKMTEEAGIKNPNAAAAILLLSYKYGTIDITDQKIHDELLLLISMNDSEFEAERYRTIDVKKIVYQNKV